MPETWKPFAKAVVGFATALVGALAVAAVDGSISLFEWLTALAAALGTLGAVYQVKNK
jgi:peptidoglycan/LPS O-acetylase OafA/YrhL